MAHAETLLAAARPAPDGVIPVIHHDDRGRDCGEAWAIVFKGRRLDVVFGCDSEALGHLCLLQGRKISLEVEKRISDRRGRMARLFSGDAR